MFFDLGGDAGKWKDTVCVDDRMWDLQFQVICGAGVAGGKKSGKGSKKQGAKELQSFTRLQAFNTLPVDDACALFNEIIAGNKTLTVAEEEAKNIKAESLLGAEVDSILTAKKMKTRYKTLLLAQSKKHLLEEFKSSFLRYFKTSKNEFTEHKKKEFLRDLLKMVTKPQGASMLTLVEHKGLVDKFQPKCFTNSKFTIVPGEGQVFVIINDTDEHIADYIRPGAKLNIGNSISFVYINFLRIFLSILL